MSFNDDWNKLGKKWDNLDLWDEAKKIVIEKNTKTKKVDENKKKYQDIKQKPAAVTKPILLNKLFTTKNILIGTGVLLAGIIIYKRI
jgi:hypothetical protein